jgi:DNA-directed RNA polymerase specialized sigma24 family protein
MQSPHAPIPATDRDSDLAATVVRERSRLGNFIRRRVHDPLEAEDLLQDVLEELVEAYRLPEPLEQASAWLFRVATYSSSMSSKAAASNTWRSRAEFRSTPC